MRTGCFYTLIFSIAFIKIRLIYYLEVNFYLSLFLLTTNKMQTINVFKIYYLLCNLMQLEKLGSSNSYSINFSY